MSKIVAVDFDGTLFVDKYPNIGEPIMETHNRIKQEKEYFKTKFILWTCREGKPLEEAVEKCLEYGIEFDAINENLPEIIDHFGTDSRKISANEYWDDRAVRVPSFKHLRKEATL